MNIERAVVSSCLLLQYVYQPAMLDPGHGLERVEEGVAIFSRHTITDWDYTMLSRWAGLCGG